LLSGGFGAACFATFGVGGLGGAETEDVDPVAGEPTEIEGFATPTCGRAVPTGVPIVGLEVPEGVPTCGRGEGDCPIGVPTLGAVGFVG